MSKNKLLQFSTLCIIAIFLFSSCAKVYHSQDYKELCNKQKTIAIIPPAVSIPAKRKQSAESVAESQKAESNNIQKEIYSWILKRKSKGKIMQEVQDIETTNALLKKAGYPDKPLTPSDMCKALHVDGVITSNFALSKPFSTGGAIAFTLLVGGGAATNQVGVSMSINDCSTDKMIWNYNHKYSGGLGSTPSSLVDYVMRRVSKKMPYTK